MKILTLGLVFPSQQAYNVVDVHITFFQRCFNVADVHITLFQRQNNAVVCSPRRKYFQKALLERDSLGSLQELRVRFNSQRTRHVLTMQGIIKRAYWLDTWERNDPQILLFVDVLEGHINSLLLTTQSKMVKNQNTNFLQNIENIQYGI